MSLLFRIQLKMKRKYDRFRLALAGLIFLQAFSLEPINNAYFMSDHFHYLNVTKIRSVAVDSSMDCAFSCLDTISCFSFNLAASPDVDGKLWCELLATDKYNASDKFQASQFFHHFSISNPCSMAPCKNGGKCIARYGDGSFECRCPRGSRGATCEIVDIQSCSDIVRRAPSSKSGSYVIDPDGAKGLEPFAVFCDMSSQGGVGVTIISHNSEDRTLVDGYEARGSYSRDVTYVGASLGQLAGLTRVSSHCEQFIKFECYNAAFETFTYHWLVSRDGAKMEYWGGASPGSHKCACGMNNTCANPSLPCNCDKDDDVWRGDSGLLTHKPDLPVSQLRFGDTGVSYEKGYYTLGKLQCSGLS